MVPASDNEKDSKMLSDGSLMRHGAQETYGQLATKLGEALEDGELPQIEIRCRDLSVSADVQVSVSKDDGEAMELPTLVNALKYKLRAVTATKRQMRKDILKNVTCTFQPGTMTLVLGQPGSGKSTLMRLLSGHLPSGRGLYVDGDISVNGQSHQKLRDRLPQLVAFVPQKDEHQPLLTVKETLEIANGFCPSELLRRPHELLGKSGATEEAVEAIAGLDKQYPSIVVKQLGLGRCQGTILGNGMLRGVSGGERKRVTLGEMSFGLRPASFMDEISTGLDASATFDIIQTHRHIADKMRATIVTSLLQPSPEVVDLFDDVLLLNAGEVMYYGPVDQVAAYFAGLGFHCPPDRDVADFLLDLGTPQQTQYQVDAGGRGFSHPRLPAEFSKCYQDSDVFGDVLHVVESPLKRELKTGATKKLLDEVPVFGRSLLENTRALTRRQMTITMRNAAYLRSRMFALTFNGLVFGSLFWQLRPQNVQVVLGIAYQASLFLVLTMGALVPIYVSQRDVFYKQRRANFFQAAAYVISSSVCQFPFAVFESIYFGSIVYWMCGFVIEAGPYFTFLLLLFVNNLAYAAWFFFLAAVVPNMNIIKPIEMLSNLVFVVFTGFIMAESEIPPWFIWIYWLNPLTWCFHALAINQYRSSAMDVCVYEGVDYCREYGATMGEYLLSLYDIRSERMWIWLGIAYMLAIYVVFIILGYLALEYKRYDGPEASVVTVSSSSEVSSTGSDDLIGTNKSIGEADYAVAITPKSSDTPGVALDVHQDHPSVLPVALAFEDLWYAVPKPGGASNETIDLLKGISGYALPGTMTALMGSSGAGKTTLMDVIAGRKTGGTIKGRVLLNGHEATPLAIQRSTGYCEQTDVHSNASTIREAITLSAFLRQDSSVSAAAKYAAVDECLEMLDMKSIAGQIVRVCSAEQLKRLTIGVELAAQPSVLFLDEPTSGLDARTAKIIMDGVRRVADSGRTVLCTIHQPSAGVFSLFDSLLLLKRGGETVFFGDLGPSCKNLVDYFEAIPGISPLPDDYNPATWMLECIGAGVEGARLDSVSADVDFVTRFQVSEQCRIAAEMLSREGIGNASASVSAMSFGRKRAAGSLTQFAMLMRRFVDLNWRTPSYNITRFAVSLIQALIFGVLYIDADYTTYTGANAGMGLIFITSLFNGMIPFNAVMPIASQERAVFYRERAAQTYSAVWYWLAETLVEVPYSVASALLFTVIFYPMVGFPGFTEGVLYWVNTSLLILMLTYFGQLFVYAMPSLEIAMILGALCSSVLVMFMGFNPPGSAIPTGYKWLYHITPQKYSMGVFAALVFANCPDEEAAAVINGTASDGISLACHMLDGAPAPYTGLSIKKYVEQVFLTKHDELVLNFGVQVAFIALFLLVKLLAMRFANHQKR